MLTKPSLLRFRVRVDSGDEIFSDEVDDSHDNRWQIKVPNPNQDDNEEDPLLSVRLFNPGYSGPCCSVLGSFILRDSTGKKFLEKDFITDSVNSTKTIEDSVNSTKTIEVSVMLGKRSVILANNILLAGTTLLIDVFLQVEAQVPQYFGPHSKGMVELLDNNDRTHADVCFQVDGELFHAHKAILALKKSEILYSSVCEQPSNSDSPLVITGICKDIFRIVLRAVYEELPSKEKFMHSAQDILDAANRFHMTELKIVAETEVVCSLGVTAKNALDWAMFAKDKECPLIKEYALSICAARSADLFDTDDWKTFSGNQHLVEDLMCEMAQTSWRSDISVMHLRNLLHEKGEELDGSKETLFSRLSEDMLTSLVREKNLEGKRKRPDTDGNSARSNEDEESDDSNPPLMVGHRRRLRFRNLGEMEQAVLDDGVPHEDSESEDASFAAELDDSFAAGLGG